MSYVTVALVVGGAMIALAAVFGISVRLFGLTASDRFKNALELTKAIALVLVAGLTFVFIDRQQQTLSQAEHELKVYQTFLEAANSSDTRVKVRALGAMTAYRSIFLAPETKLDEALVELSRSIAGDEDVRIALAAPTNGPTAAALVRDRSQVIQGALNTLESLLGSVEKLSSREREEWANKNAKYVQLPFPIQMGFDPRSLSRVRVHAEAAPFFEAAFREIDKAGLRSSIQTIDGVWSPNLQKREGALAGHVYGVAIDLNAAMNPLGTSGNMDPRLITIFKRNGFVWGGDWTGAQQNPMHFEVSTDALAGRKSGQELRYRCAYTPAKLV